MCLNDNIPIFCGSYWIVTRKAWDVFWSVGSCLEGFAWAGQHFFLCRAKFYEEIILLQVTNWVRSLLLILLDTVSGFFRDFFLYKLILAGVTFERGLRLTVHLFNLKV